jgi:hypothetical protein
VNRREFIKTAAVATTGPGLLENSSAASEGPAATQDRRKLRYVGWQVGITYQTPQPGGLDRDYLLRLLDEMAGNRMNLLSLMMISYGYFDPHHDGYCWPVRNPNLRHYWDSSAANAQASTEFLRSIIAAAAARRIEVQLFLNWGIWNPEKIRLGYPSAELQINREKKPSGWLHCPDSPGAWQAGLDEAADLLHFYDHPNVTSFGFERVSYAGSGHCFCRYTQEKYRQETGGSLLETPQDAFDAWKVSRMSGLLQAYVRHIRSIRPNLGAWLHTRCAHGWGHDPARLKACGIDYLLPHVIQFPETREKLHQDLARMAPNSCVLHFCTRDRRPANYNLWLKTPEIITQAIDWVVQYPGNNLAGILFFNEVATSPKNKKTVYDQIRRFDWP